MISKIRHSASRRVFTLTLVFSVMFALHSINGQCGDTLLFNNSSFEQQTCCPLTFAETHCIIDWSDPSAASTDYVHTCGYPGAQGPPPFPLPDGEGCIGFYTYYEFQGGFGGNEMIQTCISTGLNTDQYYQFSAYIGFNSTAQVPSRDPITMVLFGSIGDCSNLPTVPGIACPYTPWDVLTEMTLSNSGNSGWVYGLSDCFQPALPYDRFIIGAACDPIMVPNYNFMDAVELHTCFDAVPIFDTFPSLCQGITPPILPTVTNNLIPITGTWSPSSISTSFPGLFNYTFTPSMGFCSSPVTIEIEIIRQAMIASSIEYTGCQGDGYEVVINNVTYNELNPAGTEIFDLPFVCDSTINIQLTYLPPLIDTFKHIDCSNSAYSIIVNSTEYSINNPTGTELLESSTGCDSTVYVELEFIEPVEEDFVYYGCAGDGYSIEINGVVYDITNPAGTESLLSVANCDSVVEIALVFDDLIQLDKSYMGCQDDGFTIMINGITYDESNPAGTDTIKVLNACDTFVNINLQFHPHDSISENYTGCKNDGYSIIVNGIVYNEAHPTGLDTMQNTFGCDSIVQINLEFKEEIIRSEIYSGCIGDGYFITVNNVVYNESNRTGQEIMQNADNCDSIVNVNLSFDTEITRLENHQGCVGDGYVVVVNNITYNELNPTGQEIMQSIGGCDSIVTINLMFNNEIRRPEIYLGCIGDGYSIVVNHVTYNEINPMGEETMQGVGGCDSIVSINLEFSTEINRTENHLGCIGDDYFIIVNNIEYNEQNPSGSETMLSSKGCDSTVSINLAFDNQISRVENYVGCVGDGYSIMVNNVVYDDSNPTGQESMKATGGCDSVVTIDLKFNDQISRIEQHIGCANDGYSITVNNVIYNETNPTGQEVMRRNNGCDSIVTVNLEFNTEILRNESYSGCKNDTYSITVNNTVYNETSAYGLETMTSVFGCDSIVTVQLEFSDVIERAFQYTGCTTDGFSIQVNNTIYDENNPTGAELISGGNNCDTLVHIALIFSPSIKLVDMLQLDLEVSRSIDISQLFSNFDTIVNIQWSTTASLSCTNCLSPKYLENEGSSILVTISDLFCTHTISLIVLVQSPNTPLFIPTVFSPNDDGINDIFIPLTGVDSSVEVIAFDIFNRWGASVFSRNNLSSSDISLGWDGMRNDKILHEGVYVYHILLEDGRMFSGSVTLVR